jgi:hypothetical protein
VYVCVMYVCMYECIYINLEERVPHPLLQHLVPLHPHYLEVLRTPHSIGPLSFVMLLMLPSGILFYSMF